MTENINLRKVFGEYLEKLGHKNKNLCVLDSDLTNQLHSLSFAKTFPERHFSVPSAESSMIAMATGFTVRKKIPFVCGNANNLVGKGLDMIMHGIIAPNINVKLVIYGTGLARIEEGLNSCSINDISTLYNLPNLKILTPVDSYDLKAMMEFMLNDYGPTVLRLSSGLEEDIHNINYQFMLGEPEIITKGDQICLFTEGNCLAEAIKATTELAKKGMSVQVVNLSTITPLNQEKVKSIIKNFELIITIEDHLIPGGIATIINELALNNYDGKIINMGITTVPESGKHAEIMQKFKLDKDAIYETVRESWLTV